MNDRAVKRPGAQGQRSGHALTWPAVVVTGMAAVGGLVWSARRRSGGGRHEMPDLPGAHEDGTFHVTPDGELEDFRR